jgi:hypothetical protein
MEYAFEGHKTVAKLLESVMPSILDQLKLENCSKAVLVKIDSAIPKESDGSMLYIAAATCYLVVLRPPKRITKPALIEMITNFAHEMVHVKQHARGILKITPTGDRSWKGKEFGDDVDYLDKPWEIEAFSRQELICRRALKVRKANKVRK